MAMDVYDTIYSILDANGNSIRGRTAIQKLAYRSHSKVATVDMRSMAHEIAECAGIEKHDVVVHSSEIQVNLYEGEIMIMWKGVPRKLDEFSPINANKSAINKFYVFGPGGEGAKRDIRKCVEDMLGTRMG